MFTKNLNAILSVKKQITKQYIKHILFFRGIQKRLGDTEGYILKKSQ